MWSSGSRAKDRLNAVSASVGAPTIARAPDSPSSDISSPDAQRRGPLLVGVSEDVEESRTDLPRWFTAWDGRARKAALVIAAALAVVLAWWWWTGQPEVITPLDDSSESAEVYPEGDVVFGSNASMVLVHVVGKVANPGVVELPGGSRVKDAIDAAGGATRAQALETVNLARPVVDGEQIVVGRAANAGSESSVISLNSADSRTLQELPGVGPAIADRIIQWREKNGPFRSIDELTQVSGIGPAMMENIRDLVGM